MASELTINEVAKIAEVPASKVEKAIETGVLKPIKRRGLFATKPVRHLTVNAVCYFATIKNVRFLSEVSVARKKRLMKVIRDIQEDELKIVELEPGLHLDLPSVAGPARDLAKLYVESRKKYIMCDPDIFGGVPIIKGTRLPVYVIRDRLMDGETVDDLVEDYPDIPPEAFLAANIYARTHPERGRPVASGRPWEA